MITAPICATPDAIVICRYINVEGSILLQSSGSFSVELNAPVCPTPSTFVEGTFYFKASINGGTTFPFSGGNITFVLPTLTISKAFDSILGGDVVVITGATFDSRVTKAVVNFDNLPATCTVTTDDLTCTVPILYTLGAVNIRVSLDGGATFPFKPISFISFTIDLIAPTLLFEPVLTIGWFADETHVLTWNANAFTGVSPSTPVTATLFVFPSRSTWQPVATVGTSLVQTRSICIQLQESLFGLSVLDGMSASATFMIRLQAGMKIISTEFFIFARHGDFSDSRTQVWAQTDSAQTSADRPACPCTSSQAGADLRFFQVKPLWKPSSVLRSASHLAAAVCLIARFPNFAGAGVTCCYDAAGSIINPGLAGAGTVDAAHTLPFAALYSHQASDLTPFQHSCANNAEPATCNIFHDHRPSPVCTDYVAPVFASVIGLGHFHTFDGTDYNFNGLGEYILATVSGFSAFQLQGRMVLAPNSMTSTALNTVVASEKGSTTVQVSVTSTNKIVLLGDGIPVTPVNVWSLKGVVLTMETNRFNLTFASGTRVVVSQAAGILSVFVTFPEAFSGHTAGLLGRWDGAKLNDFLLPDRVTTIPVTSSVTTIFSEFAPHWLISTATSIFTYPTGITTASFVDPSFIPAFVAAPLSNCGASFTMSANTVCGTSTNCLADAAATCNVEVATKTVKDKSNIDAIISTVNAAPPVITLAVGASIVSLNPGISFIKPINPPGQTAFSELLLSDTAGTTWVISPVTPGVSINVDGALDVDTAQVPTALLPLTISVVATNPSGISSKIPLNIGCTCGCDLLTSTVRFHNSVVVPNSAAVIPGSCDNSGTAPTAPPAFTCSINCASRESCVGDNSCDVCNAGYSGPTCAPFTCSNHCATQTNCVADNSCTKCNAGFFGPTCDTCNAHGTIDAAGHCACEVGFDGPHCEIECPFGYIANPMVRTDRACDTLRWTCPANCRDAVCPNNECANCKAGFDGGDCHACPRGMGGPGCNTTYTCGSNCDKQLSFCSDFDTCAVTCLTGFKGKNCNETCEFGYSGVNCAIAPAVAGLCPVLPGFRPSGLSSFQTRDVKVNVVVTRNKQVIARAPCSPQGVYIVKTLPDVKEPVQLQCFSYFGATRVLEYFKAIDFASTADLHAQLPVNCLNP